MRAKKRKILLNCSNLWDFISFSFDTVNVRHCELEYLFPTNKICYNTKSTIPMHHKSKKTGKKKTYLLLPTITCRAVGLYG